VTATLSELPYLQPYVQPHRRQDWPLLIAATTRVAPPVPTPGTLADMSPSEREASLAALRSWNQRLGPIGTRDTARVAAAMESLIASNLAGCNGGRDVLLINGHSKMGKSQAVVAAALIATQEVWNQFGMRYQGNEVIPYIYVEAVAKSQGRALLQSIFSFIGVPFWRAETTLQLLLRLREILPELGTRAIIIDDAHALRTGDRASRELTDALKALITGTPCSFVFVGAGLEDSALLRQSVTDGYPAAQQIGLRSQMLEMLPWKHTRIGDDWSELVGKLERHILLPTGPSKGVLTDAETLRWLHTKCSGLPGVLIDTVKKAAAIALDDKEPLKRRHLEEVPRPVRTTS
jgi:Bacterial TniB protein